MIRHDAVSRPPRDRGLQAERTALAWNRTGLAVLVNALLALRSGWSSRDAPITILAFALLLASGAAIFYGAWRRRELLSSQETISPPTIGVATAAVVALGACGVGVASIFVG